MTCAALEKAKTLVEALPYIRKFAGQTLVIKFGGSVMVDERLKTMFAADMVLLKYVGINPVIVHGGGKEISRWMERVGKQAVFVEGLRVTDSETMEITEMVLTGKVNGGIVSCINQQGGRAIGLSGIDGNLLRANRMAAKGGEDLGLVGEIKEVNTALLKTLTDAGYIPVIASVGVGNGGESLNINADEAASGIAGSLEAMKLIYLTDVDGVMKGGRLIEYLDLREAEELFKDPELKGGMRPKVQCAIKAIKSGVRNVHILNGTREHVALLELFTDSGIGTKLSHRKE